MDVVIIGGGIAGLSTAIFLKRFHELKVTVLEQVSEYGSAGFGFLLLPNGIRTFRELGLASEILSCGYPIDSFTLRNSRDQILQSQKLSFPIIGVSRTECLNILRKHVPKVINEVKFSHFEMAANKKVVISEEGGKFEGDWYIAADGAHSKVRRQLFPDFERTRSRVYEIVGVVNAPQVIGSLGTTFLKISDSKGGLSVGFVPTSKTTLVWFIQFDRERWPVSKEMSVTEKQSFVAELIGKWPEPAAKILKSDFNQVYLWEPLDAQLLPQFYQDNVLLIGDAAHPLLPFTSQGANSALEDALFFSKCFEKCKEPISSFKCFNDKRRGVIEQHLTEGKKLMKKFLGPIDMHPLPMSLEDF